MKGIQHGKSYGSLDDTIITIEADESTPLLVDRKWIVKATNVGSNNDGNNNFNRTSSIEFGDENANGTSSTPSSWSIASSSWSHGSNGSTKSFKSHFKEINVLAFAFVILAGLSIAIYLLIIETRLPSITFSLDLIHHDAWSRRPLPRNSELNSTNVHNVILMQTESDSCDNSYQCMKVLHKMQDNLNNNEELPYNFLIAGEGLVYEVRGWGHECGMPNVPQASSLVIGIMGHYTFFTPENLIRTAQHLITESVRRHKLQPDYEIHGFP